MSAEFALLRLFAKEQAERGGSSSSFSEGKPLVHAVYVAPLEALVAEKFAEWSGTLGKQLGIKIAKLTGEGGGAGQGRGQGPMAGCGLGLRAAVCLGMLVGCVFFGGGADSDGASLYSQLYLALHQSDCVHIDVIRFCQSMQTPPPPPGVNNQYETPLPCLATRTHLSRCMIQCDQACRSASSAGFYPVDTRLLPCNTHTVCR